MLNIIDLIIKSIKKNTDLQKILFLNKNNKKFEN